MLFFVQLFPNQVFYILSTVFLSALMSHLKTQSVMDFELTYYYMTNIIWKVKHMKKFASR